MKRLPLLPFLLLTFPIIRKHTERKLREGSERIRHILRDIHRSAQDMTDKSSNTSEGLGVVTSGSQAANHEEVPPPIILLGPYIARHWRGELSLVISYWINTFLVGILFAITRAIIDNSVLKSNMLLGIQSKVLLMLISIPVYIWQIVGCWRSANRNVESTGRSFWARVTQVVLVLGVIYSSIIFITATPWLVEYAKIATRTEDFTDFQITVLEGGKEIEITGYMAFGVDRELERVLKRAPNVYLIHLNSPGGRLEPARKVRELIEERGLSTYTATECNSAALVPFMAGRYRILNTKARLGFHSYRFPGATRDQMTLEMDVDKRYFQSKGIDGKFLDKAFRVDSEKFWFPEIYELIQSKVITHTLDGKTLTSYTND